MLVGWKLERLGRSLLETMKTIDRLSQNSIHFESLTETFDIDMAMGRYVSQIPGATAEFFLGLTSRGDVGPEK